MAKISVVIPCFNCVNFVRATVESVIRQKLDVELEVIIVDGGSTDGSLEILNEYRTDITHFISEPDEGHYSAVNKGFALATGEVLCWLNSDDLYVPGALSLVSEIFDKFPDIEWLSGIPVSWDGAGRLVSVLEVMPVYGQKYLRCGEHDALLLPNVMQETCFWRRSLWEKAGPIRTELDLAGDYALWTQMARYADLVTVDTVLGGQRKHLAQRSHIYKEKVFGQVRMIRKECGGRGWIETLLKGVPVYALRRRIKRLLFPGRGRVLIRRWDEGWDLQTRRIAN